MQGGHKKLKPGLVASYDIWPGNGECLFWFWCFINLWLTYLDTYPLTYSPGTHTGPMMEWQWWGGSGISWTTCKSLALPDRSPSQHLITHFLHTGCSSWCPKHWRHRHIVV